MTDKLAKYTEKKVQVEALVRKPELLEKLSEVATPHMQPERLTRVFLAAASKQPKILDCTPQSISMALMTCSQLGLEPNTPFGQAYLIPYWNPAARCLELQFQAGYKGLIALAQRTGKVKRINAQVFYRQEIEAGLIEIETEPPKLVHRWSPEAYPDDDIAGAYCVIVLADDSTCMEVMGRGELDKIWEAHERQATSRSGKVSPAWRDYKPRMFRKAPIKRLINGGTVPLQDRLLTLAIENDIQADLIAADFRRSIDVDATVSTAAERQMRAMEAQLVHPEPDTPSGNDSVGLDARDGTQPGTPPPKPTPRKRRAITQADLDACGPDSPAAAVDAARRRGGVKMADLRRIADNVPPERWDAQEADRIIAAMEGLSALEAPEPEPEPSPPVKPETPSTTQPGATSGDDGPKPQAVHSLAEFDSLCDQWFVAGSLVDAIAQDQGLDPDSSRWTAADLTDLWASVCEAY